MEAANPWRLQRNDVIDVVLDDSDVQALTWRPRLGIAAQTTQPLEKVQRLVGLIRQRFPQSREDLGFCKITQP